jgi:hypothetical protein
MLRTQSAQQKKTTGIQAILPIKIMRFLHANDECIKII